LFEELDSLAERGALDELVARVHALLPKASAAERLELHHYLSWAWFELGDPDRALREARLADDPLDEAKALFHLWRFDEAGRALAQCGDEAEAHWYRALVAEFTGGDPRRHRAAAIRGEPSQYHEPTALSDAAVDRVLQAVLAELPAEFAPLVRETAVSVLPLPEPHPDVDPLSLGLYVGQDIGNRSHDDGVRYPPRIEIYQRNVERIARNEHEAKEELRITLQHELAHHFGFDEDGVADLGLA